MRIDHQKIMELTETLPHQIQELRDRYDYRKSFDICLAAAFEECEGFKPKHGEFYDSIGSAITTQTGKKVFLPHTEVKNDWPPRKVYDIINHVVVPTSDLILVYHGLPSTAAGMILGQAVLLRKPLIYFYEEGTEIDPKTLGSSALSLIRSKIEFKSPQEGIDRLVSEVQNVYNT